VQLLPQLLARYGEAAWQDGSWENAVPRVAVGVPARVDRLRCIGNAQVPRVAALAWEILTGGDQ
jgi:DNA (cytosine-5)-methyltransferase 1